MVTTMAEVLVLEDEPMIQAFISQTLSHAGFGVLGPFATAHEAMKLLDGVIPDVAVLDVGLQGGTCFEVADRLTEAAVPVVFTSGYPESDLPGRFRSHAHLAKPFGAQALIAKVSELVRPTTPGT